MRFAAQDEVIAAFLKKYDSIPSGDRERLPIEAIGLAAGVDLNHLLGSTILALASRSANMTKIIAVTSHPLITKARVKFGQMPSGEKDRTALDTSVGWLPTAKGPTFIGKAIFGSGNSNTSDDDVPDAAPADTDDTYNELFPSPTEIQNKLVPIRQRLLTK